jgi:hypothetical protein
MSEKERHVQFERLFQSFEMQGFFLTFVLAHVLDHVLWPILRLQKAIPQATLFNLPIFTTFGPPPNVSFSKL